MAVFEDVQGHNDALVRKALGLVVAVAPMSVDPITTLLSGDEIAPLPVGWTVLGRPTEDGLTWPRETELSELYGHGSTGPARSDIRRATRRLSVTAFEDRRVAAELSQGIDLSAVPTVGTATAPEVVYSEPELPTYPYMRVLAIARDVTGSGALYAARQFSRGKVTEAGEQVWSDQDQAVTTPLTFTAFHDDDQGWGVQHFRAGPGLLETLEDEGWAAAPAP